MSIPRHTSGRTMGPDPAGDWIRRDDVLAWIEETMSSSEVTFPDGETEYLCSDWCWEIALNALRESLGWVDPGDG